MSDADQWSDWSDQQLADYEESLYDREVSGENTWFERDQVLWEMNRRGMMDNKPSENNSNQEVAQ